MTINVFPPARGGIKHLGSRFALQQDNWNDYSFRTLYHLYYQPQEKASEPTLIGPVKILRYGQSAADTLQITQAFEQLGPDFCSVGSSLDYYARLSEIPREDREGILQCLQDVVANPIVRAHFQEQEGWRISLFRDNDDIDGFLNDALAIYTSNFSSLADISKSISFRAAGWSDSLDLHFGSPEPFPFCFGQKRRVGPSKVPVLLPRRVVVVIGMNGSGKSTLLSRIARVAFASPSDRKLAPIRDAGEFDPASIGFPHIIAISYSAFDNFSVPAVYNTDIGQIASDIEKGGGRYVYAGLRDIVAEARDELKALETGQIAADRRFVLGSRERSRTTKLKALDHLADEFARLIGQIDNSGGGPLLDAALEPLLADPSFVDVEGAGRAALLGDDPRSAFMSWSTGHKIALHVVASLVSHATHRSLVLFDEPETHLHPPLVAALMNAVRIVLEEKNAFAIVATHSPVILQETLAQHVRIVSRVGEHFSVEQPKLETFGENAGILTQTAFGLTSAATDYHHVLDLLIENTDSIEQINALFSPGLSGQALGYVMAGLARKKEAP